MIKKTDLGIAITPFGHGEVQALADFGLVHGLVSAEGNHDIQLVRKMAYFSMQRFKDQTHGSGPGPVRNNDQDTLVLEIAGPASGRHHLLNPGLIQRSLRRRVCKKIQCIGHTLLRN